VIHSASAYRASRCRCPTCTHAHAVRVAAERAQRAHRNADAPHGTWAGYDAWGCRCDPCKAAMRIKNARRRAEFKNAKGLPLTALEEYAFTVDISPYLLT
jgi:hypothetical protein